MTKQKMAEMLKDAKDVIISAGLASATAIRTNGEVMADSDGALVGQLIMAVAIEESDSSTSLDRIATALNNVASRIREK